MWFSAEHLEECHSHGKRYGGEEGYGEDGGGVTGCVAGCGGEVFEGVVGWAAAVGMGYDYDVVGGEFGFYGGSDGVGVVGEGCWGSVRVLSAGEGDGCAFVAVGGKVFDEWHEVLRRMPAAMDEDESWSRHSELRILSA